MPEKRLARFVLLPNLELKKWGSHNRYTSWISGQTKKKGDFCPKCGVWSEVGYDRRKVRLKDEPIRASSVYLTLIKRRYYCKECRKPFTEKIPGVLPGRRTTERFRRAVLHACERYSDLKTVRKQFRISDGLVYRIFYEQLELKLKKNQYPWPKIIGIDEHSFQKRRTGTIPFASLIVDYSRKKPYKLIASKRTEDLKQSLAHIPGRNNVQWAITDLCDPFKNFVHDFFPNAQLVADKFHVLRLLHPALNAERKQIAGRSKYRSLILMSPQKLDFFAKHKLLNFLNEHAKLKELWIWKQRLHRFYNIRGLDRARWALYKMLEEMKLSNLKEIKRLRRTLHKWAQQILNYFKSRLTNARTEGFNNKAKVIKRKAYGFRTFRNYELRLLCAGL